MYVGFSSPPWIYAVLHLSHDRSKWSSHPPPTTYFKPSSYFWSTAQSVQMPRRVPKEWNFRHKCSLRNLIIFEASSLLLHTHTHTHTPHTHTHTPHTHTPHTLNTLTHTHTQTDTHTQTHTHTHIVSNGQLFTQVLQDRTTSVITVQQPNKLVTT